MLKEVSSKVTEYCFKHGLKEVKTSYGEIRKTNARAVVFENGWVADIVENLQYPKKQGKYSIAMCDYDGYFNWEILNEYGADDGCFYCNTDDEIINACEIIRKLPNID